MSSARVHLTRFTLGSTTLIHRSRHCLGFLWESGPTSLLNSSAMRVHSLGYDIMTPVLLCCSCVISSAMRFNISVSWAVQEDFFPSMCWMNSHLFEHYWTERPGTRFATFYQSESENLSTSLSLWMARDRILHCKSIVSSIFHWLVCPGSELPFVISSMKVIFWSWSEGAGVGYFA